MDPKSEKRYKNAREMFQALQNVYKKDARYRKLVIGQRVAMLGLVAGMGLSIIAIGYGIHTMKLEKVNRYNEIVKQQTEYRKSGEYEKEEAQYQKQLICFRLKKKVIFRMPVHCMNRKNTRIVSILLTMIYFRMKSRSFR